MSPPPRLDHGDVAPPALAEEAATWFVRMRQPRVGEHERQRFRRWLANRRIEVAPLYGPLIQQALQEWGTHTVSLALDTSMLGNQYCLIRLSVVYRGRAVPVAQHPDDEPEVDPAEHEVHAHHRPHRDQAVEHDQDHARDQVQDPEAEHPGLQQGEDQQGTATPPQEVEPVPCQPRHTLQASESSPTRSTARARFRWCP